VAWSRRTSSPLALLVAGVALLALAIGGLSGLEPRFGIAAAIGLTFVALVFIDLLVGFATLLMLAFLEALSVFGGVSLAKVTGALLVIAWLALVSTRGSGSRNLFVERPLLVYLLLAFLGWNAISLGWSESSGDAVSSTIRYTLNAILVPIAYTAVRDRRDAVRILATIVLGAGVAGVSGIVAAPGAVEIAYDRATGTVGDANELAAALVVGLAIAGAFAINRHIAPLLRALSGFAAGLCLIAIFLSLSRGGLLGIGGAVVTAIVVGGRWRPRVIATCGLLVVLGTGYFAYVAPLPAKERVLNVGGGTGRLDLWTVGLRMVDANPVAGVGTGQFADSSVHYLLQPGAIQRGDLILSTPKIAHNTYLNVVAELGVVGGVLFAALLAFSIGCAVLAVRRLRRDGDERLEILARGFIVGLGGYLVTLLFISEHHSKLLWILIALGPALLAVASERHVEPDLE
jgi:O-antigen ligase